MSKPEESKVDRIKKGLAALNLAPTEEELEKKKNEQRRNFMMGIREALIDGGDEKGEGSMKVMKKKKKEKP